MSKRRHVNGIPLIEKPEASDDCPRGGNHEDLPFVSKYTAENGDELVEFYCLKCHFVHWSVFPKKEDAPPATEPTMTDDNPILDGVPHA